MMGHITGSSASAGNKDRPMTNNGFLAVVVAVLTRLACAVMQLLAWLGHAALRLVAARLGVSLPVALSLPPWEATGRGIVITGASSGIGEELAYQYSRLGAKLVLCARREAELRVVADKCKALGAQLVQCVVADVSRTEDCQKLMEEAAKAFDGTIDMMILNAGISMGVPFEDVEDLSIYRRLINVNYYGCVDCAYFALPYLKRSRHAKIVVISSLAGKGGVPHRTGYCASKFALHGFFETLRQELARYPIGITMVCPGFVRTNINATRLGPSKTTFDLDKAMPVEEAGRIIVEAAREGKREEIFTPVGKIGQWVRFFVPQLYDLLAIYKITTETRKLD